MAILIREPHVAGRFYPGTAGEIEKMFDQLFDRERHSINYELSKRKIIGAVLPHAGIIYSGYQAIHFFEILSRSDEKFETFVILHPLHRGGFHDYASDQCKVWRTPLGDIHLDDEFIQSMGIIRSASLHESEHSAEVIVPFIQKYVRYSTQIVPVGISVQHPEISMDIARRISDAKRDTGRKICILASSDFSHYVKPDEGRKLDKKVTDKIIALDSMGVFEEIRRSSISVCGYGPIMALIDYAAMNYSEITAEIIAKGHSGEIYPSEKVVDYISILFHTES